MGLGPSQRCPKDRFFLCPQPPIQTYCLGEPWAATGEGPWCEPREPREGVSLSSGISCCVFMSDNSGHSSCH